MVLPMVMSAKIRVSFVTIVRKMHSALLRNWKDATLMVVPLN